MFLAGVRSRSAGLRQQSNGRITRGKSPLHSQASWLRIEGRLSAISFRYLPCVMKWRNSTALIDWSRLQTMEKVWLKQRIVDGLEIPVMRTFHRSSKTSGTLRGCETLPPQRWHCV
jgi:hypothetical protein